MPSGRTWRCYLASSTLSRWYPEDGHWALDDFGFIANDTSIEAATANRARWFQLQARRNQWYTSTPNAAWPIMYCPPGKTFAFNNVLNTTGPAVWKIHGRMLMVGDVPAGGAFLAVDRTDHVYFVGDGIGIVESWIGTGDQEGLAGNVNLIAIGNHFQIIDRPLRDIRVSGLTLRGARCWNPNVETGNAESEHVPHGGGKGITLQHGADGVVISDVLIDDCDIGLSLEGAYLARDGDGGIDDGQCWVRGPKFAGVVVHRSRYMGALLGGTNQEMGFDLDLTGVTFVNCASGERTNDAGYTPGDPAYQVCERFGVITNLGTTNVSGNVRIFNENGRVTLMRGNLSGCDLTINAHVHRLKDAVDLRLSGGYLLNEILIPQRNTIDVRVQVDDSTGCEYLLRSSNEWAGGLPRSNYFRFTWRARTAGTWVQTWPGSGPIDFANLHANNSYYLHNLGGTNSSPLTLPTHSALQVGDGVNNTSTAAAGLVLAVPAAATATVMRVRQGGTDVHRLQTTASGSLQFAAVGPGVVPLALTANGAVVVGQSTQDVTLAGRTAKMPSYSDGTRPAAATVGANSWIWNTTDNAPNYSDGTNWCLMDGTAT